MSEQTDDLTEEAEFEVEEPLGNPAPPPDVDLEKLRGDRIGDTVFSGKWCIQTVMKLIQSNVVVKTDEVSDDTADVVDMDEELQNEVGALWDMTSNVQVCQYLHSVGAVESICYVISNSRCPRATEMCVGMLANIIYHNELWNVMKNDKSFFSILIQLLTSTDQPVLLEVNRFFNTALCHEDCELFYTALNENGPLVSQELLRILSGSTNGELLKQVTELVYSLMYRDQRDTEFNARFADPDFVLAVAEASKELGLSHESSGQNHVMEIFHSFTTYDAGVEAIGSALVEVSASGQAYLRTLCQHGLSLASSCQVVTAILNTLHHVLARSSVVRQALLASPSFLHCVLTTLVALYRKLGLYHVISDPSLKVRQRQLGASQTTWQSQEEREEEEAQQTRCGEEESSETAGEKLNRSPPSGAGGSKHPEGSWSERAFAAARLGESGSETGAFRTPEASPMRVFKGSARAVRELEVSWSERRLASPLVAEEEEEEEKWKLPRERRRLKKREDGERNRDKETTETTNPEKDEREERFKQEPGGTEITAPKTFVGVSETEVKPTESGDKSELEVSQTSDARQLEDSSVTLKAMRIQGQTRADSESRLSGGFTPSGVAPDMANSTEESTADADRFQPVQINLETLPRPQSDRLPSSAPGKHGVDSASPYNIPKADADGDGDDEDEEMGGFDYMERDNDDGVGGEMNKSMGGSGAMKYRTLLGVIRDLLVEYLNCMAQVSEEQDGSTSIISPTVRYLDGQCSSTELRALTRCVRDSLGMDQTRDSEPSDPREPQGEGRQVLQRLLAVCDRLRATHLKDHELFKKLKDFLNMSR